jgi:hypothetical protein
VGDKRNSTVMMITNEDRSGGRSAGIDNPGFEEDERPATVGNGGSVFISVTTPSNGNSSFLNSSGVDMSMLTEVKDVDKKKEKEVAEAVNLELVSMNPFSGTLETNGVNGIPVKKDGEQAALGDAYADPYDEYFVPVNEHRKYMRWVVPVSLFVCLFVCGSVTDAGKVGPEYQPGCIILRVGNLAD